MMITTCTISIVLSQFLLVLLIVEYASEPGVLLTLVSRLSVNSLDICPVTKTPINSIANVITTANTAGTKLAYPWLSNFIKLDHPT